MSEAAFETTLIAVEDLETARNEFHAAVREAHIQLLGAKFALEARYADLSLNCVPQSHTARWKVTASAAKDKATSTSLKLTLVQSAGDEATADAKDDGEVDRKGNLGATGAKAESKLGEKDPVYWFSLAPPKELKSAQEAFLAVQRAALRVAEAEQRALALAEEYRTIAERAEQ